MDVKFVARVSPIVRDTGSAQRLYADALGLSFEGGEGDYVFTERLDGVKHLGLWRLADAAQACFRTTTWPEGIPTPQASVEFEVDDVAAAAEELERAGYQLLHGVRTEGWGQVTARLLTADGLLVAVCYTPWLRTGPSPRRDAFWQAVDAAGKVLATPALGEHWDRPSALEDMTVGDLAAHLVRAVTTVVDYLSRPAPAGEPIAPGTYFLTLLGDPRAVQSPQGRAVRQRAREESQAGHHQALRRWQEAVAQARDTLDGAPPDRLVEVAGNLVLTLDDYLATRVVELVVHADDLAVSLRVESPPAPAAARLAEHVLLDVARGRHGDTAVLRALARGERASGEVLPVL